MRCEKCKKHTATVRIKQLRNGKKIDVYLCDSCSGEIELSLLVENLFKGLKLHGNFLEQINNTESSDTKAACSNCGITLKELKKGGNLGCSACYQSFISELIPIITQAHGGHLHEGKFPRRGGSEMERELKLRKFKELMQQAVAEEDFDKAAMYRDRIKTLANN